MKVTFAFVAKCLGIAIPVSGEIPAWSTDSREPQAGGVFVALRGERFDGHDFAGQALEQGALAVLVDHEIAGLEGVQIVVPDTLRALQEIAAQARREWNRPLVGVTGSAGKTSTKEAVAALLGAGLAVGKTVGNLNNHIGVPLSILRIADEAEAAVLEMGMNHAGEITRLCEIAGPDVGVVTNVGWAHVEHFEGIEGIASAKRELIEGLRPGGTAVLNADDPRVAAMRMEGRVETFGLSEGAKTRAVNITYSPQGADFEISGQRFHAKVPGRIGVLNICAAVAVARMWGIPLRQLAEAAGEIAIPKMRQERLEHNGMVIWNDCYNSNPDAAKAMLDVLRDTAGGRRIAVLGEMLELGHWAETLHRDIGSYAVQSGVSVLIGIRGAARFMTESAMKAGLSSRAACFFESPEEAGDWLKQEAQAGDSILFKGSRGTKVELALERFLR
jgi:UDP-N-acetylmuramoyl-tripeptide--D-alanyl-D-alanine ligase